MRRRGLSARRLSSYCLGVMAARAPGTAMVVEVLEGIEVVGDLGDGERQVATTWNSYRQAPLSSGDLGGRTKRTRPLLAWACSNSAMNPEPPIDLDALDRERLGDGPFGLRVVGGEMPDGARRRRLPAAPLSVGPCPMFACRSSPAGFGGNR
jgi:hypothetical protein